jgi:hypothetical protein
MFDGIKFRQGSSKKLLQASCINTLSNLMFMESNWMPWGLDLSNFLEYVTFIYSRYVATPLWKSVRMTLTFPKWGLGESFGTPENSELDCKGQNTLPWVVFYTVGKVLKRKCRKWPCMTHSNICSTSYVQKKGHESN